MKKKESKQSSSSLRKRDTKREMKKRDKERRRRGQRHGRNRKKHRRYSIESEEEGGSSWSSSLQSSSDDCSSTSRAGALSKEIRKRDSRKRKRRRRGTEKRLQHADSKDDIGRSDAAAKESGVIITPVNKITAQENLQNHNLKQPPQQQQTHEETIRNDKVAKGKKMIPMSKEQYDAQQSVVREVFDEETGRCRLVRGSGEIIERIVMNRTEHRQINRMATLGDGQSFARSITSVAAAVFASGNTDDSHAFASNYGRG